MRSFITSLFMVLTLTATCQAEVLLADNLPEDLAARAEQLKRIPPPDFTRFKDVRKKKKAFFDYFAPLVRQANAEVLAERSRLLKLEKIWKQQGRLSAEQVSALCLLAEKYKASCDKGVSQRLFDQLKIRIDAVPPSLVLAQAANESAWGTSRFARLANNYFGIWCFKPNCGLVPSRRNKGSRHQVRKFDHPLEAVRSYLYNINVGHAYEDIRALRARLRKSGKPVTGYALAEGLIRYSERGPAYVKEIRSMIRYNRLDALDG